MPKQVGTSEFLSTFCRHCTCPSLQSFLQHVLVDSYPVSSTWALLLPELPPSIPTAKCQLSRRESGFSWLLYTACTCEYKILSAGSLLSALIRRRYLGIHHQLGTAVSILLSTKCSTWNLILDYVWFNVRYGRCGRVLWVRKGWRRCSEGKVPAIKAMTAIRDHFTSPHHRHFSSALGIRPLMFAHHKI